MSAYRSSILFYIHRFGWIIVTNQRQADVFIKCLHFYATATQRLREWIVQKMSNATKAEVSIQANNSKFHSIAAPNDIKRNRRAFSPWMFVVHASKNPNQETK